MLHLAAYIPEMIETRRHLHHHPEIAWTEFLTTQTIVKRVRELGFKTILGKALFDTEHALGREEKVIEEAMQRSLKLGMDPALLKELEGYTGCMAVWETGKPGPVTALRFDIDCVNVEENMMPPMKRIVKALTVNAAVSCTPADTMPMRPWV